MRNTFFIDPESRLLADAQTGGKIYLGDPKYHHRVGALIAQINYAAGARGLELVRQSVNRKTKLLERIGLGRRPVGEAAEVKRAVLELSGILKEARACRESEARSEFLAEAGPVIELVAELSERAGIVDRERFRRIVTPELLQNVLERIGLGTAWLDEELRGHAAAEVNEGLPTLAACLLRLGARKLADWAGHFYFLGRLTVYLEVQEDRTGKGWYGYLVRRDPAGEQRLREKGKIELVWAPGLEDVLDRTAPLAVGPARPLLPKDVLGAPARRPARAS